jgi:CHASE3 domain sensor protein
LKPYNTGSKKVIILLNELGNLTVNSKAYTTKLDSLSVLIKRRLADLSGFITKFQKEGFLITDEVIASRIPDKQVMDNIRVLVQELKD